MKIKPDIIFHVFIISFSLLIQDVYANQWFVKPSTEVPLRRGMGTEYKIVAIVKDGTAVNVLDRQKDWTKIRLANGREGWILRRFLSKEKPLAEQLTYLNVEKRKLEEKIVQTDTRFQELIEVNARNEQELSACINERDKTRAEHEQLKIDTRDVIGTKEKLTVSEQQLEKLQKEIIILEDENNVLKNKSTIT